MAPFFAGPNSPLDRNVDQSMLPAFESHSGTLTGTISIPRWHSGRNEEPHALQTALHIWTNKSGVPKLPQGRGNIPVTVADSTVRYIGAPRDAWLIKVPPRKRGCASFMPATPWPCVARPVLKCCIAVCGAPSRCGAPENVNAPC